LKVKKVASLASPDIFGTKALSDEISFDMENSSVKPIINRKIDESVTSAFEVLRERIDKFGVTQPNIQRLGDSGRILIELPGAKDISRIQNLLQSTAQLEFWDVYKANAFSDYLANANAIVAENIKNETEKSEDVQIEGEEQKETETDDLESLLSSEDEEIEDFSKSNPLLSLVQTVGQPQGPIIAYFAIKDTAKVNSYLAMPQVKSQLPADKKYAKFVWGKPSKDSEIIQLYALKGNRNNEPQLSGAVVTDAQQSYDQVGRLTVSMQMDGRGSKIWEDMTGKASTQASQIAIVLDNIVYSAPGVSSGSISGGRSEISGDFSIEEAQDFSECFKSW